MVLKKIIHHLKNLQLLQMDDLIHQNHMPGTADRKPFRETFHDSQYNYL